MLITQRPHTPRLHQKTRILQPLPNPPNRERPQYMPMPRKQHIPISLLLRLPDTLTMVLIPYILNKSIKPLANIGGRFSARTAVAPDVPRGKVGFLAERSNFVGGQAFVVAVVPFADVFCYFDAGIGADGIVRGAFLEPGEGDGAAEAEELDCSLGAVAGGYVAVFVFITRGFLRKVVGLGGKGEAGVTYGRAASGQLVYRRRRGRCRSP